MEVECTQIHNLILKASFILLRELYPNSNTHSQSEVGQRYIHQSFDIIQLTDVQLSLFLLFFHLYI